LDFGLHPIESSRFREYSHPLINAKYFSKTSQAAFALSAVLLTALSECVGSAEAQNVGITVTPPVVVAPAVMPTAEEVRAAFGNNFDPDGTLNGAIAQAAAGDLAGPAVARCGRFLPAPPPTAGCWKQ
jgi:hypothetical protein